MYHFAHIAAYYTQRSRSVRGLISHHFAHMRSYYRHRAQGYRWASTRWKVRNTDEMIAFYAARLCHFDPR